jgi:hypothetical protein
VCPDDFTIHKINWLIHVAKNVSMWSLESWIMSTYNIFARNRQAALPQTCELMASLGFGIQAVLHLDHITVLVLVPFSLNDMVGSCQHVWRAQ